MTNRLSYIDGMRGLAIMLVVGFHAFSRWPELMPFDGEYKDLPLFRYGWLGVQLFFLISGFVITMTLERTVDFKHYLIKRWIRLFPAMAICSAIIFLTASLIPERPAGSPDLADLLPGLLFIDPYILTKLSGIPATSLESAFWSLYVEVLFYLFAAIVFMWVGTRKLFYVLAAVYALAVIAEYMYSVSDATSVNVFYLLTHHLKWIHFGWFAAGCGLYQYQQSGEKSFLYLSIAICIISSLWVSQADSSIAFGAIFLSTIFILAITIPWVQWLMSNRVFVWLGFISYPLYLLHENMMVGLTIQLSNSYPGVNPLLSLFLVVTFICTLSYFVARVLEVKLRNFLTGRTFARN